ncbi:uncharacterized protein TNCV_2096321 [Trichonephila clavipes]|nr:uncharacterized protein TNCV_2096321 [Trichonephila clavipes]
MISSAKKKLAVFVKGKVRYDERCNWLCLSLQLWLFPQLEEKEPNNFIWQQDGSPPHWHLSVRDWLNITAPDQWNARKELSDKVCVAWLPYSPDLKPCDFYLWGFIKDCVQVPPLPADLLDLRHRIDAHATRISLDTLKKVWDEFAYQLDLCRVANEAHIEHL